MYILSVALIAVAGFCAVSSTQIHPASSDRPRNLTSPLDPQNHREIEAAITYEVGQTPIGIELVTSIAYDIYACWIDTANAPVTERTVTRRPPISGDNLWRPSGRPRDFEDVDCSKDELSDLEDNRFQDFEYTIEPLAQAAGASLTPFKIGIVACKILDGVVQNPYWPGKVRARIWDMSARGQRTRDVGQVDITNSPRGANKAPALASKAGGSVIQVSGSSGTDSLLSARVLAPQRSVSIPPGVERKWLHCWTNFYLSYVVAMLAPGLVADTFVPGEEVMIGCGGGDGLFFSLSAQAARESRLRLTWEGLAGGMLSWMERVATGEMAFTASQAVVQQGVAVARLNIRVRV